MRGLARRGTAHLDIKHLVKNCRMDKGGYSWPMDERLRGFLPEKSEKDNLNTFLFPFGIFKSYPFVLMCINKLDLFRIPCAHLVWQGSDICISDNLLRPKQKYLQFIPAVREARHQANLEELCISNVSHRGEKYFYKRWQACGVVPGSLWCYALIILVFFSLLHCVMLCFVMSQLYCLIWPYCVIVIQLYCVIVFCSVWFRC